MAFHIRDPKADGLVRELARRESIGLTEAVTLAASEALDRRSAEKARVLAAVKEIQDRVALWPKSGLKADKAFYDSLNDEED